MQSRPRINHKRLEALRWGWRCALATLSTVDRGVARLIDELRRQGRLDDTAIFFTSDNGYLFGEHRIVLSKVYPYEESLRVPLLARLPGGARQPSTVGAPVNNLDLTATILDLADAVPCTAEGDCRVLDGRSLLPLLRGKRPPWADGRGLLVQAGSIRDCGVPATHLGLNNFYDAVRTKRRLYVELHRIDRETGACGGLERELYDIRSDPFELRNRASANFPSPVQAGLARRLESLRTCSGISGRDPAGSRPFCE